MPVIECSCGMVMSIAADDSRCHCIRCGGLEFRVVSDGVSTPPRHWKDGVLASSGRYETALVLAGTFLALNETANESSPG